MKHAMRVFGVALLLAAACGKSAGGADDGAAIAGAGGEVATVPPLREETGAAGAAVAAAAGGADGGDRVLPLDADGCPSGDWRIARFFACLPPSRDCFDPGTCSTPAMKVECVDGVWKHQKVGPGLCSAVVLGPDGCPQDYRDADGYPCEDPSVSCPPTADCEIPLLLCVNHEWEYNFHESDCSQSVEELGSGGQSVGGAAGAP